VSLWPDVSLREVGAWGYVRATAGLTSSVIFALLLASSSASARESDREALTRERRQLSEQTERARSASLPASPEVTQHLRDVTQKGGFSVLGGLLVGATFAWAARGRREALAR
jgi:hypothetical protein